jgi:PTH1 family peptidyl-tRNA hydrolase
MLLLVGLGNPGSRYAGNRHNIGFMVVDAINQHYRFGQWHQAYHGHAVRGPIDSERVLLLKPDTYMNESGRAVMEAVRYSRDKLAHIIVFHDEIELPFGKVRVKTGGGNAGHNGLRSISAYIGNDYRRVRIGVGHPGVKELVEPYVLSNFDKDERPWVAALCEIIADNAELLVKGQDASFQNKVHLAMQAKGFLDGPKDRSDD